MFSTSLVAVPAFSRVEPLSTSGPTTGVIARSTAADQLRVGIARQADGERAQPPGVVDRPEHVGRPPAGGDADEHVAAPKLERRQVVLAELGMVLRPSTARVSAAWPPAMTPTTCPGGELNVGGHSVASSTPSRPDVPAPA